MKKLLSILLFLLLIPVLASGQTISGVTSADVFDHGTNAFISGSSFGTKSPALPLVWDDCETETANTTPSTSSINSYSRVAYSDIEPPTTLSSTHEMLYRADPYTPTGATATLSSMGTPHSRSTKIVSFGHEDGVGGDGNDGANGWLSIPGTDTYESDWFISYYTRLAAEWPACGSSTNNKFFVFNFGGTEVWGGNNYHYWDYNKRLPCSSSYEYVRVTPQTGAVFAEDDGNPPLTLPDTTDPWGKDQTINANIQTPEPQDGWQKYSVEISDDDGFIHFLVDNEDAWWGSNITEFFTTEMSKPGIRSVSIGGYYRRTSSPNEEHDDAHRAMDDIYIDDTFSRVMLGNASTIAACTVLEPQIPSAWSSTYVTVELNLGALADDSTAYVYVYDSDNSPSSGYAITLGSGSGDSAPTVTITAPTSSATYETSGTTIALAGSASDDSGVTEVTWINDRGGSGTCTGTTSWSVTGGVSVYEGTNVITVTAEDDVTQTGDDILTVTMTTNLPPTITDSSGSLEDAGSFILTGTQFGTKSPAAPLIWDNCRGGVTTMATYYDDYHPQAAAGGSTYNIQYRELPYRNVSSPDSFVTYAITGAHAETDSSSTYDQGGTVGFGWNTTEHTYFMSYYYRIDPLFEDEDNDSYTDNMKEIVLSTEASDFYGDTGYGFTDWCNADVPDVGNTDTIKLQRTPYNCPDTPYRCSGNNLVYHDNPINDWIRMQWIGSWNGTSPEFELTTYPDGARTYLSHYGTPVTMYAYVNEDCGTPLESELNLIGVGGFARVPRDNLGVNSFRYWAGLYYDDTHSRVVLGDAVTMGGCTYLVPQPPSAWADGEITFTIVQGDIPDDTDVYAYVYNSSNETNGDGFSVGQFGEDAVQGRTTSCSSGVTVSASSGVTLEAGASN